MGIFQWFRAASPRTEERAVHIRPSQFIEAPPFSGEYVTPNNADSNTAVNRAVQLISNDLAKVPMRVMRRTAEGREEDTSSALWRLFDTTPNVEQSGYEWRRYNASIYLRYGNALNLIQRNARGSVLQLLPMDPDSISIQMNHSDGTYWYEHATIGKLEPEEVLHFRSPTTNMDETGVWAESPIRRARETLGLSKAQLKAGASTYRNSAQPRMSIQHPGNLSDKAAARLAEQFTRAHSGPESAGKAILLEEGMTASVLSPLSLESTQWLQARDHQIQEVSRIFGVPSHMLSDLSGGQYSNIQSLMRTYVDGCLSHHAAMWAAEIQFKMLSPDQFVDFDLSLVQRGSFQDEIASLNTAVTSGIMTPDECRVRLGHNPMPGLNQPRLRKDTGGVTDQEEDPDERNPFSDDFES